MVHADGEIGGKFGDFSLPVCHERCRYDDKRLRFTEFAVVFKLQQCGDHLKRFAQPHVIGNQGADAEPQIFHQPCKAARLIGTQCGVEVLGRSDVCDFRERFETLSNFGADEHFGLLTVFLIVAHQGGAHFFQIRGLRLFVDRFS